MSNVFYLDMDGVVADWVAGVEKIINRRIEDPHEYCTPDEWTKIRTHARMFKDLPVLPNGNEMANMGRKFRDNLGYELIFLSAVPHYNDIHWAFWDKMTWAQQHFSDIPVHFGPYSRDKQVHCKHGDILVDDRIDNCQQWTAAGGISFHVQWNDYDQTLRNLEKFYQRRLSEVKTVDLG